METASLARRLGLWDATALGLGSMLGAGVFVAFGPAARAAGGSLLPALMAAAIVAYCNASASAQLASRYPASGGTYVYGRKRLGEWAGFLAGWGFVTGKTASCAAMALTFGLYLAPGAARQVAVAAVVVLTSVNLIGISRTALLTKLLLVPTIAALVLVIVVGLAGTPDVPPGAVLPVGSGAPAGVLQAAGLLFFAFAGYARIATLGEEVRRPERTIPLAILLALATAVCLYALVALALLHRLGAAGIAASPTPLLAIVDGGPGAWLVGVGAVTGSLGALLALVAGVGRTALAMARERDLPTGLARIGSRAQVPVVAELSVA
ncbi:MAG: transporter, partial [Micrococcaceae bacterium]|nr:transporter [Micrococcaceae bacterium]